MSVFLPVETAARELHYKLLLAMKLAHRGVPSYLGRKSRIDRLLRSESKYVYVDKGYHRGRSEPVFAMVHSQRGSIVSLDEEGAVDFPDSSTLLNRYAPALFENAALVFLWGQRQYELVRERALDPDRIVVSGHPRFQMLHPTFRVLYRAAADEIRHTYGRFVLVNTNMGFGNNFRGSVFVQQNYRSRIPRIDELIAFDQRKVEMCIATTARLAQGVDRTVVVRPHPEEDAETYRKALAAYPNVHVVFQGSVVPWLMAADVMVHPDCTTAIEASLLGRRAISVLPAGYDPELVTALPVEASIRTTGVDDVLSTVERIENDAQLDDAPGRELLEQYFSVSRDAVGVIVDRICDLMRVQGLPSNSRLSTAGRLSLWRGRLRERVLGRPADRLLEQKAAGLDVAEVNRLRAAILLVAPELSAVRVCTVVDGLFAALPAS